MAAPPLGAYALYYLWLTRVNGVPITQTLMRESLLQGGWSALAKHAEQMALIEAALRGTLPAAGGGRCAA